MHITKCKKDLSCRHAYLRTAGIALLVVCSNSSTLLTIKIRSGRIFLSGNRNHKFISIFSFLYNIKFEKISTVFLFFIGVVFKVQILSIIVNWQNILNYFLGFLKVQFSEQIYNRAPFRIVFGFLTVFLLPLYLSHPI